jgi:ABC-type transport system involved in cytochrome c biogenesis permease subunit
MAFGFAFTTLGIVVGSTWAFVEWGTGWLGEPRIGISIATWALYLAMVFLRVNAGWRGRKAALLSIVALCGSAITWAAHSGLRLGGAP